MVMNALSVDVEEYYHAAIFQDGTSAFFQSCRFESRVERSMDRLLQLLQEHHTKATFFVLGEVADAHPSVVRRIAAEGHEVACHSDRHKNVYRQSPAEFRADLHRVKARLEDLVGAPIAGFRAPNFSIANGAQSWAYPALLEEGFTYDSSIYPILHDRYGQPHAPRFPYEIWREGSASLTEFPIGTARLLGVNFPVGGGGYFRLLPFGLIRMGIQHVNDREQRPVMFYIHPWELDPDQPRVPMAWRHRWRHYVGVEKEATKLSQLLLRFRFGTARDVLQLQEHRIAALGAVIAARQHSYSA